MLKKSKECRVLAELSRNMNGTHCPLDCSAPTASVFLMSRSWPLIAHLIAAESCSHSVQAYMANNLKKDTCLFKESLSSHSCLHFEFDLFIVFLLFL